VSVLLGVAGTAGKWEVNFSLRPPTAPTAPHPRKAAGEKRNCFSELHIHPVSSWEETAISYLGCFTPLKCEGRVRRKEIREKTERSLYFRALEGTAVYIPEAGWGGWWWGCR